MKDGEDAEPDIFVRVGNNSDDESHAFVVANIHGSSDVGRAAGIHGIQAGEIGQQTEAWDHIGQSCLQSFSAAARLIRVHLPGEIDLHQIFCFVSQHLEHREAMLRV